MMCSRGGVINFNVRSSGVTVYKVVHATDETGTCGVRVTIGWLELTHLDDGHATADLGLLAVGCRNVMIW